MKAKSQKATKANTKVPQKTNSDDSTDFALGANYIGFPIPQLKRMLASMLYSLEGPRIDNSLSHVNIGCRVGMVYEKASAIMRAIEKAEQSFSPNPQDNPLGVVLIKDMAPMI